jgi:hypothetical protein
MGFALALTSRSAISRLAEGTATGRILAVWANHIALRLPAMRLATGGHDLVMQNFTAEKQKSMSLEQVE